MRFGYDINPNTEEGTGLSMEEGTRVYTWVACKEIAFWTDNKFNRATFCAALRFTTEQLISKKGFLYSQAYLWVNIKAVGRVKLLIHSSYYNVRPLFVFCLLLSAN